MDPEPMLFVKKDCPNCELVKRMLGENHGVDIYDLDTVDGMTEAAFYGLLGKTAPLLLVFNSGDSKIYTDIEEIAVLLGVHQVSKNPVPCRGVCVI